VSGVRCRVQAQGDANTGQAGKAAALRMPPGRFRVSDRAFREQQMAAQAPPTLKPNV
jgi:hypothetical protein